jgi:SAM-dependent methyltransferase
MNFDKRACPACGRQEHVVLFAIRPEQFGRINWTYRPDFAAIMEVAEDTPFPIVRCRGCGFVYASLLPDDEALGRLYDLVIDGKSGYLDSESPPWVAHQLRLAALALEETGTRFSDTQSLKMLDFGCGYGRIMIALSGPRVECLGFETSVRCLEQLEKRGLAATGDIDQMKRRGPFHSIVLSDVLEHVARPREVLSICRSLLVPRGVLCVNVPQFESWRQVARDLEAGRTVTRGVNPWEHLNYFSRVSLRKMLVAEGFRPIPLSGPIDVGLRLTRPGIRRWGNLVKSMGRLLSHVHERSGLGTTVCAEPA